jgi:hypothetical protein
VACLIARMNVGDAATATTAPTPNDHKSPLGT